LGLFVLAACQIPWGKLRTEAVVSTIQARGRCDEYDGQTEGKDLKEDEEEEATDPEGGEEEDVG
jgi:hypothetical protein